MRDLNFFEPFREKRQFRFNKMNLLYVLLFVSLLTILALASMNLIQIRALNSEVASLREVADNPETMQKVQEIKEFEEQTNQFRDEVSRIVQLDKSIQARDIVGERLLNDVNSKLPEGVFVTNLNLNGRNLGVSGAAEDKYSVAEFAKGLSQLMDVSEVFISNISEVQSKNTFTMDVALREALADGN